MDKKTYVIKMAVLSKLTMDFDNCIFKILWRKTKKNPTVNTILKNKFGGLIPLNLKLTIKLH